MLWVTPRSGCFQLLQPRLGYRLCIWGLFRKQVINNLIWFLTLDHLPGNLFLCLLVLLWVLITKRNAQQSLKVMSSFSAWSRGLETRLRGFNCVYIKLFSLRRVYPQRADYKLSSAVIIVQQGTAATTHHTKSKVRKLRLFLHPVYSEVSPFGLVCLPVSLAGLFV